MVPGAMTRANMNIYMKKRNLLKALVKKAVSSSSSSSSVNTAVLEKERWKKDLESQLNVPSQEVDQRRRRNNARGVSSSSSSSDTSLEASTTTYTSTLPEVPSTNDITNTAKKQISRGRVKKNLPKRKSEDGVESEKLVISSRASPSSKANNLELKKYYSTPLLTPEEEFDLGRKVQVMIQCERVHEGLCLHVMRLPTLEEWANACGFREEEPDFQRNDIQERQLRPAGCETMFQKMDPNLFVGNGLAHEVGVGRGRGRAKKPPPTTLKDVYQLSRETGKKVSRVPINRGTPSEFCEMVMEGRRAKQLMVQSNMRLVISIAKKYTKTGVSLQDLVQDGSLGLSRAAEKYDPTKGFKFSTYASW
jgi:DNA-directed RNA polymerase sigma subunit (sigma70/sigma32)